MDTVAKKWTEKGLKDVWKLWTSRFPSQSLWGHSTYQREILTSGQWVSLTWSNQVLQDPARVEGLLGCWKCPAVFKFRSLLQQGWHLLGSWGNPGCGSVTAVITTPWCPVLRADTTGISSILSQTRQPPYGKAPSTNITFARGSDLVSPMWAISGHCLPCVSPSPWTWAVESGWVMPVADLTSFMQKHTSCF